MYKNIRINVSRKSNATAYVIEGDNSKIKEVLNIYSILKDADFIDKHTVIIAGNKHETLVLTIEKFVSFFNEYSAFRDIRKALDLSKIQIENEKTDVIYIYIKEEYTKKGINV